MSIRTSVKQMLVRQQDKKYEAELAKLRVTYAQWAAEQEKKIAETVVTEIGERAGLAEFVIYRQQKGQLAENAVERINAYFVKHPEAEIVYGDEDLLSENGERVIPWFKPCWAPGYLPGFLLCGKRRGSAEQTVAETGGARGCDRRREHRQGNSIFESGRDPSPDGSAVSGGRWI